MRRGVVVCCIHLQKPLDYYDDCYRKGNSILVVLLGPIPAVQTLKGRFHRPGGLSAESNEEEGTEDVC